MADEHDVGASAASETEAMAQTMAEVAQTVQSAPTPTGLEMLKGVNLTISVELGRTRLRISEVLKLGAGSVVELHRLANEPVDVLVNDVLFAHGEVVVIDDAFAIRITELVDSSAALGIG